MTVRVKVVSLLSVKHQQFCWKTNWKLISGVGHGAGSFSKPAVWLPKQKQHSYLKSSILFQLLIQRNRVFKAPSCGVWGTRGGLLVLHTQAARRSYLGISGACDCFTSNTDILAFQIPSQGTTHLAMKANFKCASVWDITYASTCSITIL